MAEEGQLARIAGRAAAVEPGLAELLDPLALEERLKEARARRAAALARRGSAEAAVPPRPDAVQPAPPALDPPLPAPPSRLVIAADPRYGPASLAPVAPSGPARLWTGAHPVLIFLAGLGLGSIAVVLVALPSLTARIAALSHPPAAVEPAVAPVASAASPVASPAAPAATPASPATARAPHPVATSPAPPAGVAEPSGPPATARPALAFTSPEPAGLAEPASEAAPPHPQALKAALPAPQPAAGPDGPAAPLPALVYVHYPPSAAAAAAQARDTLRAAGVAEVEIVPARFGIGHTNVRFYHDEDAPAANTVSALLAPGLPDDTPEARDFTGYPTPSAPGKLEVWLAGSDLQSGSRAPRAPAPAATAVTTTALPPLATPETPEAQAEAVARILVQRTVDRLSQDSRGGN